MDGNRLVVCVTDQLCGGHSKHWCPLTDGITARGAPVLLRNKKMPLRVVSDPAKTTLSILFVRSKPGKQKGEKMC